MPNFFSGNKFVEFPKHLVIIFTLLLCSFSTDPLSAEEEESDAKEKIRKILSKREYEDSQKSKKEDSLLDKFFKWLKELLGKKICEKEEKKYEEPSGVILPIGIVEIIFYIIFALIIILVIYHLIKYFRKQKKEKVESETIEVGRPKEEGIDPLSYDPHTWKDVSKKYFYNGEFREAIRAMYLSILVFLHRRRIINYRKSMTNWQYLRQIHSSNPVRPLFKSFTKVFDYKWYGKEDCSEDDYHKCRRMSDHILLIGEGRDENK